MDFPFVVHHVFYVFVKGWVEIKYYPTMSTSQTVWIVYNYIYIISLQSLYGSSLELGGLVEKFGTTPKQNLTKSSYLEISNSNLEQSLFRLIFLAVLA